MNKDDWVLNTQGIFECGEDLCKGSPCVNNGQCVSITPGSYRCDCGPHYIGDFCEKFIDPCDSNPCKYSSTCTALNSDSYVCKCSPDRTGFKCDIGKLNFY